MSASKHPLRTAIIGLSANSFSSWGARAYLPALLASKDKYTITGLLNSSKESAEEAVKFFKLPETTKTYNSPEELANDKDIDVVICSTRGDKHHRTILPSLQAGKDVIVEWPIAANLTDTNELVDAAKKSGSRVSVGLQRRWYPAIVKIKELVSNGTLGKVLSSDAKVYGGMFDPGYGGYKFFAERKVGSNPMTILPAHTLDYILAALGTDLKPGTINSRAQLQRPDIKIVNPKAPEESPEIVRSDVPDLITYHAGLVGTDNVVEGGNFSWFFSSWKPFPGTLAFDWIITLERGEIRFNAPSSALDMPPQGAIKVQVHKFGSDNVETFPVEWSAEQQKLGAIPSTVKFSLDAFADGKAEGDGWVSLDDAANRARQIDGFLAAWDRQQSA